MIRNEESIRRRATELLDEVGVASQPVDPEQIARCKGIRLETQPFPNGVYGALYCDGQGFGIVVSDACHGEGHRRFTIAHELGHYYLDGHADQMFAGGTAQVLSAAGHFRNQRDPLEREADCFASELLMPTTWTASRVHSLQPTLADISSIADQFAVSLTCAAIRFAELTDDAVAVVLSLGGHIEWVAFSSRLREHGWSRKAWKRELIPRGTATHRLAHDPKRVSRRERDTDRSLLCTWFDDAPAMIFADEEAVGLGDYKRVLTALSTPTLPTQDELDEEESESTWRERDWRDAVRTYRLD